MNVTKYSLKATFKGMISNVGMVLLVIGVFNFVSNIRSGFSIASFILEVFILYFGIIFFLSIRGTLIDEKKRQIKEYFDLLIFKIGKWETIDQFDKVILKYINESQTMNYQSISRNIHTKTYDIILKSNDKKKILVKECYNYNDALELGVKLSKKLNLPFIDTYEILLQQIEERKQYVRR